MEIPAKRKPLDPVRVLKQTLPTRKAQEEYHRALEAALPIKITRLCGKWIFSVVKK